MDIARFEDLESRRLLSAAVAAVPWNIGGDSDGNNFDDAIDVSINGTSLVATVNGNVVGTRDASLVKLISISSGRGNDLITVDLGSYSNQIKVSIDAGPGKDVIVAGDEADSINGGLGNDTIESGAGDDTIVGGGGTDVVNDSPPTDYTQVPTLPGGSGADATKKPVVKPKAGEDFNLPFTLPRSTKLTKPLPGPKTTPWVVNGDTDSDNPDDFIDVSVSDDDPTKLVATVNGNVVDTRDAITVKSLTINAGAGDDDINVDLGDYSKNIPATINAGAGDDFVTAGDESDVIYGGAGSDTIDGGGGRDSIYGGAGADDLSGGDGNDLINGGGNDDTLTGDYGNDILDGGTGSDNIQGGAGLDSLAGDAGNDSLYGGEGSDKLDAGVGSNTVNIDPSDKVAHHGHDHFNADDVPTYGRIQSQADLTQWWIDRAAAQYSYLFGTPYISPPVSTIWENVDTGTITTTAIPLSTSTPTTLDSSSTTATPGTVDFTTNDTAAGKTTGMVVIDYANQAQQVGTQSLASAPTTSDTNVQIQGVDEADLVETDRRYIYTLTGNSLCIVDTTTAGGPSVVSTTTLSGNITGMYLDGARLTFVGQQSGETSSTVAGNVIWYSFGSTQITVMDVSDPSKPSTVSVTNLDGTLTDSRMVDGRLYVVVSDSMIHGSAPLFTGTDANGNPMYETEAEYRARLEADPSLLTLPQVATTVGGATTTSSLVTFPDMFVPQTSSDSWLSQGNITSVVLINTRDSAPAPKSSTSVVGYGDTVFATQDAMYLATYDWTTGGTQLLKFGLGTQHISFEASGGVDGKILNRFSMGESNGIFDVATTSQTWFNDDTVGSDGQMLRPDGTVDVVTNNLFTLKQVGARLTLQGSLTDLTPNENIQSVRFVGDRAYLSTFHFTDPLLSIDLSDAAHPTLTGQLIVPGFSSYLQPLSDTLLLGLGVNADPATGNPDWSGVQASLFDVSDPAHPRLVNALELNPETQKYLGESVMVWDPHAVTYIPDQHLLAIPVFGDLELLNVDVTAGLSETAVIPADQYDTIHRTVRIDGNVFAVGDLHITERAFTDLSQNVASVRIAPDPPPIDYSGLSGSFLLTPIMYHPLVDVFTSYTLDAV